MNKKPLKLRKLFLIIILILGVLGSGMGVFAQQGTTPYSDIAQGQFGTSDWRIENDGVLYVGAGQWSNYTTSASVPWHSHRAQVTKIVFQGQVTAGTSVNSLFSGMSNVTGIENLNFLDTSNTVDMYAMFSGMSKLSSIDVSSFNTSNATHMGTMFQGMSSVTSLVLPERFDTSKVTSMYAMFDGMSSLVKLRLSENFGTSNVQNMHSMFRNVSSLETLDVSNFNTSNVTKMGVMFQNMKALTSIDLSNFNTGKITGNGDYTMDGMLSGMMNLKKIKIGEQFHFTATTANLPSISANEVFTGYWQNVAGGTEDNPLGDWALTSRDFMTTYDGATMSDTWVWQIRDVTSPIIKAKTPVSVQVGSEAPLNWTEVFALTATDNVDGDITEHVVYDILESSIDMNTPATHIITATVADSSGNTAAKQLAFVIAAENVSKPNEPSNADEPQNKDGNTRGSSSPQTGVGDERAVLFGVLIVSLSIAILAIKKQKIKHRTK